VAREFDYENAPDTALVTSLDIQVEDSEGLTASHTISAMRVTPSWGRIVVATNNECMFRDGGSVRWGWGGIKNCNGGADMYWLAIPQNTTPETYQLINGSNKQCLYKNSGNGDMGFRNCVGGAPEQWIFYGNGDPLRKRDLGTSGTERYVCGKVGGGLDVRTSACTYPNVRWK
jgi:hypothetical protein